MKVLHTAGLPGIPSLLEDDLDPNQVLILHHIYTFTIRRYKTLGSRIRPTHIANYQSFSHAQLTTCMSMWTPESGASVHHLVYNLALVLLTPRDRNMSDPECVCVS